MEEKGDLRAAEEHYLFAGDWQAAVNMYRNAEIWSDAYRIAKQGGGDTAQKQVQAIFVCLIKRYFKDGIKKFIDDKFIYK